MSGIDRPYHDALLLSDFGLSVPDGTTVTGIQFDLQRNSDLGETIDANVQVLQNGHSSPATRRSRRRQECDAPSIQRVGRLDAGGSMPVGADHGMAGPWPMSVTETTYGGRTDTWGVSWTPAEVRSSGFGLSIAPKFTATKGNDRAHIDSVRATVFYSGGFGG